MTKFLFDLKTVDFAPTVADFFFVDAEERFDSEAELSEDNDKRATL